MAAPSLRNLVLEALLWDGPKTEDELSEITKNPLPFVRSTTVVLFTEGLITTDGERLMAVRNG